MSFETEMKLAIPSSHVAAFEHLPLFGVAPKRQHLVSTYFDTEDLALLGRKVALRVRRDGPKRIQTLKQEAEGGSLRKRPEWEWELASDRPDLGLIDNAEAHQLVAEAENRLHAVFTTDFHRTTWEIERNGAKIDCVLDQGEIRCPEGAMPISEVEMELRAGGAAQLFDLAFELLDHVPLTVEARSKAERGYRLVTASHSAHKAKHPHLSADMTVGGALARILAACLSHFLANQGGVIDGGDPESVHQARVALRQARSALTVFKRAIPDPVRQAANEGLRGLASCLTAAREWDVYGTETLPPICAGLPGERALRSLEEAAAQLRQSARKAAGEAMAAPETTRFLLTFEAWIETGLWPGLSAAPPRECLDSAISPFAAAELQHRYRTMKRRARQIGELDAEELHELRIAAKKMRYAVEFFSGLYKHKDVDAFVEDLKALQDNLGALHDAAVADERTADLCRALAAEGKTELAQRATGIVTGWHAARVQLERGRLRKLWSDFKAGEVFW